MAEITWIKNSISVIVKLNDEEIRHCELTASIRSGLLQDGDPSMTYTTYEDQRTDNNIIGQKAELAFLRLLQSERIAFSAICFALTYVVDNTGVTAPLQDFIISNGATIDIKADRYAIDRLGAIVPNEKLLDTHIARITIWAECSQDSAIVTFHGWNNRAELKALLQEPNAVKPDGSPMPKPCKRILSNKWRKMNDLITAIHEISPTDTPLTIGLINQQQ